MNKQLILDKYKKIFEGEKYVLLERDSNDNEKTIEEILGKSIINNHKNKYN